MTTEYQTRTDVVPFEVINRLKVTANHKEKVDAVAGAMLEHRQAPCPVRHLFYPGLYIRELTLPTGALAIGYEHKTWHYSILLKGVVRIVKEGKCVDLCAPLQFYAPPGRNVGYVLEEMVWLNVYPTDERDVETIEAIHLEPSPAMIAKRERMLMLPHDMDFERMCKEIGGTPEQAREQSEREDDLIPWPLGEYKVKIGKSYIEGKGLIATANIEDGEFICPLKVGSNRTPAGRYTNHSGSPNAMAVIVGKNLHLIALRNIEGCLGGFDGEEVTVDYRQVYALKARLLT
jgi:hypothetical protein